MKTRSENHSAPRVLAEKAHNDGHVSLAARLYRLSLKRNPSDFESAFLLGLLFHQCGKTVLAEKYVRKAIDIDGNRSTYLITLSEILRERGEVKRALVLLEKAKKVGSRSTALLLSLGRALLDDGQIEAAERKYNEAFEMDRSAPEVQQALRTLRIIRMWRKAEEIVVDNRRNLKDHSNNKELIEVTSNSVVTVEQLVSREDCKLIAKSATKGGLEHGKIGIGGSEKRSVRNCKIGWLDPAPELRDVVTNIFIQLLAANAAVFKANLQFVDYLQYTVYKSDEQSYYDKHADEYRSKGVNLRRISMVIQLSEPEDYKGGELNIESANGTMLAPNGCGDAVIFLSELVHHVSPVTSGTRESLVCWAIGHL